MARVEREFVEKNEFERISDQFVEKNEFERRSDQFVEKNEFESKSESQGEVIADWTAVSIVAITMVSLLFVGLCIVYCYLYMVRAKLRRQVGTFYGDA